MKDDIFRRLITVLILKPLVTLKMRLRIRLMHLCGEIIIRQIKNRGSNVKINGDMRLYSPDNLKLGNGVYIGEDCFFFCEGGVTIGDNTQISRFVTIYSGNHNFEGDAIPYDDTYVFKPVVIGKSVWIGMNVCILPGVTIGDGAIIGMGTVVSKDVPEGAVVVSNQQRIVKYRNMQKFRELERQGKFFCNYRQ